MWKEGLQGKKCVLLSVLKDLLVFSQKVQARSSVETAKYSNFKNNSSKKINLYDTRFLYYKSIKYIDSNIHNAVVILYT